MNTAAVLALAAASAVAIVDWIAVARRPSAIEPIAKPLTLVLLIVAAITLDPTDAAQRAWFVVALVCCLAGDVLLLPQVDRFVFGLGAFLLGHLAYVFGFLAGGITVAVVPIVALAVALVAVPLGHRLVVGARASRHADVVGPVIAYVAVISLMVVAAGASGNAVALLGALAFMGSDAVIGWSRFVQPMTGAPLVIMTTYHVGQGLLVVSLVT